MAFRSRPRITLRLEQRRPTETPASVPTLELSSSILTVDVGSCCSTAPPDSRHRIHPSSSQAADPLASLPSDGPLPVVAIVAITIGAGLLLCVGIFLFFAHRRRVARRRRAAKMYPEKNTYHSVAARPETPPTVPSSPSSLSSLSTRALLDLGYIPEDTEPSSPRHPHTPDRRSIDTVAAFRFYGHERSSHEHKDTPFIAELPATPLPQPVPAAPPTPPSSTTPPLNKAAVIPARKPVGSAKGTIYLNPAGEPWVNVPPPSIPLPAPPAQKKTTTTGHKRSAQRQSQNRPPRRPVFSLFPPPPKPHAMPKQQQHIPSPSQGQGQGLGAIRSRSQPASPPPSLSLRQHHHQQQQQQQEPQSLPDQTRQGRRNFSRPAPIAVPPHTQLSVPVRLTVHSPTPSSAPITITSSTFCPQPNGGNGSRIETRGTLHSPPRTATAGVPHFPPPPGQPESRDGAGRKSWPNWLSFSSVSGSGWRSPGLRMAG